MTDRRLAVLVAAAAVAAVGAVAAGAVTPARAAPDARQEPTTLTGCLRIGSAPTVFILRGATGPDGRERPAQGQMPRDYLLVAIPESVDPGPHVNHLVAITGQVSDARTGPPPPEAANTAERALRRLAVSGIRHVADSCD